VLFDNCTLTESNILENVQRRGAVLCTGTLRRTSTVLLMAETGWESLSFRRKRAKLILFYNFIRCHVPIYLRDSIVALPVPPRMTKNSLSVAGGVQIPFCRLECYKNSFFPGCARLRNTFDAGDRVSISVTFFKSALTRSLSDGADPGSQ